jgi:nitrite reductase (NO-forming)
VAVGAVVVAAASLRAAAIAAAARGLGADVVSPWLPLHLALAGGASTAIAGVMPFFVAALAAGHPAGARVRGLAVALVAAGAALVSIRGIAPGATLLPPVGGCVYLVGLALTAVAARGSGRAGLMVRRPIVTAGYSLALVNVAVGATIGTLAVAGWLPVLEHWDRLRPAHAWTNVIGFVSLVIVSTLLHFLPTVLGTRIVPRGSAVMAVLGIAIGAPVVVVGLALGLAPVAGGGAVVTLAGAIAMALEAARVVRARGRWTTDAAWHRMASVGLVAGVCWFVCGVALATWLLLANGATAGAWTSSILVAPLAVGWIVQVLIASWTHLVPSIGPGGPPEHAAQRTTLGRWATPRLLALNAGVALLATGWPAGIAAAEAAGGALAGIAVVASVALAVSAVRLGRSAAPARTR